MGGLVLVLVLGQGLWQGGITFVIWVRHDEISDLVGLVLVLGFG